MSGRVTLPRLGGGRDIARLSFKASNVRCQANNCKQTAARRHFRRYNELMGVRGRLILITILVLGSTVVAALLFSLRLEEWEERRTDAERTEQVLSAFANTIVADLQDAPAKVRDFVEVVERERTAFGLLALQVLDQDGHDIAHVESPKRDAFLGAVLAGSNESRADPPPPAWPRRLATPVYANGQRFVIVAVLDDEPLNAHLTQRMRRLIGTNLVLSLLGLLILIMVLTREVLRPLRQLSDMAEALGRGTLHGGRLFSGARELQQLATALRDAAAHLGAQKEELEAAVTRRTAELASANTRLQQLALTDPLTGLFNRRALEQALEQEITRQKRSRRPFSLLMIDVDHFKMLNDAHGHQAGDVVLQGIAGAMLRTLRASDIVARVGGEEFVVLLLDTDLPHAHVAADKVRLSVRADAFDGGATQPQGRVTVSVGVASWPRHGDNAQAVLAAADKALYQAKATGRDRVCAAEEPASEQPRQPV